MITTIEWRGLSDPRIKHAKELSWADLPIWLAELAEGVASKARAKCYSLVTLLDADAGRRRTNIALVHAISLDFDAGAPPWAALSQYTYVAYTTPSHTVAAPRWRVHVALATPCPADAYGDAARGLIDALGAPDVDVGASCDPARLWFSPLEESDLRTNEALPVLWTAAAAAAARPDPKPGAVRPPTAEWPTDAVAEHITKVWGSGVRHPLARALGGYLARRGWDDDSIVSVIAAQESSEPHKRQAYAIAAAERARAGQQAPGWEELATLGGKPWADSLADLARHPDEPSDWHLSGRPWSAWWARVLPRLENNRAEARKAEAEARKAEAPRLVVFGKKWWGRRDDMQTYYPPIDRVNLMTMLRAAGWDIRDSKGNALTIDYVTREWGTPALEVEHVFAQTGTTWDAERQVLRVGYTVPEVTPARDADVEAWLAALFGSDLPAALQWIAACAPRHIERQLTACMVLIGPGNTGKSALFSALASMWGQPAPVPLRNVCTRFNGSSVECPIVLDDEGAWIQQGEMTSQEFLERIQQWSRHVEFKGAEMQRLVGCQRVCVTANDADAVRFRNVRGVSSLEAAADRMAWHMSINRDAAQAALRRLREPGSGYRIDLGRVRGHIAWIWATVEVESVRFAGACGRDGAERALAQDAADRYGEVYEALREAADGAKVWAGAVVKPPAEESVGTILVQPAAFHKILGGRNPRITLQVVRSGLAAYTVRRNINTRVGGKVLRFWEVSLERLPAT